MKNILTLYRLLFTVLVVTGFGIDAHATHLAGGSIQYRRTTVANQYIITLTLYNDCSGIQNQIPFNNANSIVYYRNSCGGAPVPLTLPGCQEPGKKFLRPVSQTPVPAKVDNDMVLGNTYGKVPLRFHLAQPIQPVTSGILPGAIRIMQTRDIVAETTATHCKEP